MHEMSMMAYLLEAVEEKARGRGATRVTAINLLVGANTGAIDDSLLFYFDMMTPETVAEGAKLNIRRTYMRFYCEGCAQEYTPEVGSFDCPRCGKVGRLTYDANELQLESIEIKE